MSVFGTLPDDEAKAVEIRVLTGIVFVTVNSDNFFVICQHLVWPKFTILCLNPRYFFSILVLEVYVSDLISTRCASDLFD